MHRSQKKGGLVGRRFAHQRFADSRKSIRANRFAKKDLCSKHLARFARIASSLRFALTFAWFASRPRCYPTQFLEGRFAKTMFLRSETRFAQIGPLIKRGGGEKPFFGRLCKWGRRNSPFFLSFSSLFSLFFFASLRFTQRTPGNDCDLLRRWGIHSDPVCTDPMQNSRNFAKLGSRQFLC